MKIRASQMHHKKWNAKAVLSAMQMDTEMVLIFLQYP